MLSKFGVMLSISRSCFWCYVAYFLIWSINFDVQGLTIAIFWQNLNFFLKIFFGFFGGWRIFFGFSIFLFVDSLTTQHF